jgi:hypothetical protein
MFEGLEKASVHILTEFKIWGKILSGIWLKNNPKKIKKQSFGMKI